MEEPRTQKFLIIERDAKYAAWLHHAIGVGCPSDSIVIMDWSSFGRVRTAMTARDYDIVLLGLSFDESYEEPTTDGLTRDSSTNCQKLRPYCDTANTMRPSTKPPASDPQLIHASGRLLST
jgi:hypothetical protein